MSLVTFPSYKLDRLLGPVTTIGATAYDTLHLAQANAWDTADPGYPGSGAYFYDGALVYYLLYYRTGDTQWLTRANVMATAIADYMVSTIDGSGYVAPPPRDYSTLGMAIHYLLTGYANSLTAVRAQAKTGENFFSPFGPVWPAGTYDARETAYSLIAMLATTVLGGDPVDYSTHMLDAVNGYMTYQGLDITTDPIVGAQPSHGWQSGGPGSLVPGDGLFILNFMGGLIVEALILYDRVIGDRRIAPALRLYADWLWQTQWVPTGGGPAATKPSSSTSVTTGTGSKSFTTSSGLGWLAGQIISPGGAGVEMYGTITSYSGTALVLNVFSANGAGTLSSWTLAPIGLPAEQTTTGLGMMQYGNINAGSISTAISGDYGCLLGLQVQLFGYLYAQGMGAHYKTRGDAVLAAIAHSATVWVQVKSFNEGFRSSPRYLGWDVETPMIRHAPQGVAVGGVV